MTGRAQILLRDTTDKALAKRWIDQSPLGSRIQFKGPQRSLEQNDRFWAMLTDVARQYRGPGERRYTTDELKTAFLTAYAEETGAEVKYIPAVHRAGLIPCGRSSSDLSVSEMTGLIEWMFAWGAENGIAWSDPTQRAETAA